MAVAEGNRNKSKVEFDAVYFTVHDDCVKLIECGFGAEKEIRKQHQNYIETSGKEVLRTILMLGRFIRIANSIYPTNKIELENRRVCQDKAIGLCFDLLTKYQLIMHTLSYSLK
jgi:hypothetical protein